MRDIKFRAWDIVARKYRFVVDFDLLHDVVGTENCDYIVDKDVIVEQFTGLTDKNGKEIYEGDVVKWFGYEVKNGKQIRPERTLVISSFVTDVYKLLCITESTGQSTEVIGNIHDKE